MSGFYGYGDDGDEGGLYASATSAHTAWKKYRKLHPMSKMTLTHFKSTHMSKKKKRVVKRKVAPRRRYAKGDEGFGGDDGGLYASATSAHTAWKRYRAAHPSSKMTLTHFKEVNMVKSDSKPRKPVAHKPAVRKPAKRTSAWMKFVKAHQHEKPVGMKQGTFLKALRHSYNPSKFIGFGEY